MPKKNSFKNPNISEQQKDGVINIVPTSAKEEQERLETEFDMLWDIDELLAKCKAANIDVSDIEQDIQVSTAEQNLTAGGHYELRGRERVWVEDRIKE